jgi:tetratricopeptide (TPR) repeat protein
LKKRSKKLLFIAVMALPAATINPPRPTLTTPLPPAICHAAFETPDLPTTIKGWAAGAQLFDGLGTFHRAASAASPDAQLYADQGMRWLWAFNQDEATRSFARATQISPSCALCFWGIAFAIGPNYNDTLMSAPRGRVAHAAILRAVALAPDATPPEQALIAALARRYPDESAITATNVTQRQAAYTAAMLTAAANFPADDDIQVLAAEALMDQHAWKLWSHDGQPAPGTLHAIALLETVLARNPTHPGANHYDIHAIEESPNPGRAESAADRLAALEPAAGHLVHMPAHIYQRVGRYADAAATNDRAARADLAYFARATPPGGYAGYTAHNWHFEAFAAVEIGRKAEALAAAKRASALFPQADLAKNHENAWRDGAVYFIHARFGDWQFLLDAPAPDARLQGLTAAWLWGRGTALAAEHRIPEAQAARAALEKIQSATKPDAVTGFNSLQSLYALALLTLDARIAGANNNQPQRVALLTKAVQAEDALFYDEPADWLMPTRPLLGRALLDNHRAADAETIYREDLRRRPNNGWSLLGLSQALAAQGKLEAADDANRSVATLLATADARPAYSAY